MEQKRPNLYTTRIKRVFDYQVQWEIYPKILEKINLKKSESILDAGCGNGKLGKYLHDYPSLYGFDFDTNAVKRARKKNYKEVLIRKIENTKYADKEFDSTICIQVLPYVLNPKIAFQELKRITKNRLIISVPNFNWIRLKLLSSVERDKIHNNEYHSNYTSAKFLKELARKNNLKLEIFYLSNKFGLIRNLFGNYLASEVVGVFYLR
jgi:SAM-dependent methyltransferase